MKILLVDDSKSARYALRLELQRHGAEVTIADSAEAAFEVLKHDLPDAILMDHMMPGLNGLEALDVIRADPRTAHIPVVICTSHEEADFAATAEGRGAWGILPKSLATEKLPHVLAQLRGGSEAAPTRTPVAPTPTVSPRGPAVTGAVPGAGAGSEPPGLSEERARELVDERIEAHLSARLEPLLRDLEAGLAERLAAAARQLVETRCAQLQAAVEQRLAGAHEAAAPPPTERQGSTVRSQVAALLPELLREEIEAERAQVLGLVDDYLREFSARDATASERFDARVAELDSIITAKARDTVRREVAEAAEESVARARRTADDMLRRVRSSMTMIHLSILGAALIGILAATAAYFLPR